MQDDVDEVGVVDDFMEGEDVGVLRGDFVRNELAALPAAVLDVVLSLLVEHLDGIVGRCSEHGGDSALLLNSTVDNSKGTLAEDFLESKTTSVDDLTSEAGDIRGGGRHGCLE